MLSLMSVVLYAVICEKGKDVPCMDSFYVPFCCVQRNSYGTMALATERQSCSTIITDNGNGMMETGHYYSVHRRRRPSRRQQPRIGAYAQRRSLIWVLLHNAVVTCFASSPPVSAAASKSVSENNALFRLFQLTNLLM